MHTYTQQDLVTLMPVRKFWFFRKKAGYKRRYFFSLRNFYIKSQRHIFRPKGLSYLGQTVIFFRRRFYLAPTRRGLKRNYKRFRLRFCRYPGKRLFDSFSSSKPRILSFLYNVRRVLNRAYWKRLGRPRTGGPYYYPGFEIKHFSKLFLKRHAKKIFSSARNFKVRRFRRVLKRLSVNSFFFRNNRRNIKNRVLFKLIVRKIFKQEYLKTFSFQNIFATYRFFSKKLIVNYLVN